MLIAFLSLVVVVVFPIGFFLRGLLFGVNFCFRLFFGGLLFVVVDCEPQPLKFMIVLINQIMRPKN